MNNNTTRNNNHSYNYKNKKVIDIPFYGKNNPRFLSWIVGIMLLISIISLSSAFLLENMVRTWDSSFSNGFSVELLPTESDLQYSEEIKKQQEILYYLNSIPEVESTNVISMNNLSSMIDVILGKPKKNYDVPMPTIIDVQLKKNKHVDLRLISKKIEQISPGSNVKAERDWRDGLYTITDGVLFASITVSAIIFAITIMITFFATHSQMVVNRKSIEILNLVGAPRNYVSKQFESYIFKMILKSGTIAIIINTIILTTSYIWIELLTHNTNNKETTILEAGSNIININAIFEATITGLVIVLINAISMKMVAKLTVWKELNSYDVMENTNTVFV